jgi:hypothetical protein
MALLREAGGFQAAADGMGDLMPDPASSVFLQPEHLDDSYFHWGMQVRGSWTSGLDAPGIPHRDEGPGFVYLL